MNKVIVASYMGSGSSAVTDLLSEYSNVHCPHGSYEYIFLHCPGGLFDLEDKLLVGNNALRSDEALRTFEQTMRGLFENDHWWFGDYRSKVSPRFMDYVNAFIAELGPTSFGGFWYEQEKLDKSAWKTNRLKKKLGAKTVDLLGTQLRMAFPTPDEFYKAARAFIDACLTDMSEGSNGKTLLLDQLVLPHNLWRAENYFDDDDTRIIIVSRDPRDVFALNKYVWKKQNVPIPLPFDAEDFCACYRRMREAERPAHSDAILRIQFEDLVLDYENTAARIESFVGLPMLGEHVEKLARFNPDVSKGNLGVFGFSADAAREAEIIAQRLPEYTYALDEAAIPSASIDQAF